MKTFLFIISVLLCTAAPAQQRVVQADKEDHPYCTGLFCHQSGTWFSMENDINYNTAISYFNILDWLNGRVAGLQVYTLRDGSRFPVIRNRPATVFVDEIRVDASFLDVLPVMDIAAVNVIKQPFGLNAPGGVIAVYTRSGEEEEE